MLLVPAGTGTLLDLLSSTLSTIECDAPVIVAPESVDRNYETMIRRHAGDRATVVGVRQLPQLLDRREQDDSILFIDPSAWPIGGHDLDAIALTAKVTGAAVHAATAGSRVDCVRESIRWDGLGTIRAIQRHFSRATHPELGPVSCSLVPISAIQKITFLDLRELRSQLALRGTVTRDLLLEGSMADLRREHVLLSFAERVQSDVMAGRCPEGYSQPMEGVLVGRGVRIDSSARIVGPVIFQHGAIVERGAIVVGPTVIGEGVIVRCGAVVAQSVVMSGMDVATRCEVRQMVVEGDARKSVALVDATRASSEQVGSPTPWSEPEQDRAVRKHGDRRLAPGDIVKRVIDITASLVGLVILAPLFVVIAILSRLESKGRIFYGQEREGFGGRVFRCWKFRTMCEGAHLLQRELREQNGVDGPQFKMANDPRVTIMGRWLRSTNIDELPQLWNVLVGEMSLVGPRPSPFRENQICVPWRRARLSVRPGITGLWQVCRHNRSEGDFHQWIAYDTLYVRHRSLWLDAKVFFATVLTLGGKWNVPLRWMIPRADAGGENASRVALKSAAA